MSEPCTFCGKMFEATEKQLRLKYHGRNIYCSVSCRKKYFCKKQVETQCNKHNSDGDSYVLDMQTWTWQLKAKPTKNDLVLEGVNDYG